MTTKTFKLILIGYFFLNNPILFYNFTIDEAITLGASARLSPVVGEVVPQPQGEDHEEGGREEERVALLAIGGLVARVHAEVVPLLK